MPGLGWIIVAAVLLVLLTLWVTFTATRLDRLHARVDAAQAALDAQLMRRAVAVSRLAESAREVLGASESERLGAAALAAMQADRADREQAENAVGKASNELAERAAELGRSSQLPTLVPQLGEVADSATRVAMARRFYNDAVRDTRSLRKGRMPRILHLAGHRELPQFFDIDDSTRWSLTSTHLGGPQ